jgi:signal transduction histidine kinase
MMHPPQTLGRDAFDSQRWLVGGYVLFATLWVLFARTGVAALTAWFGLDSLLARLEGPIFVVISCCFLVQLLTQPAANGALRARGCRRLGPCRRHGRQEEVRRERQALLAVSRAGRILAWTQEGRSGQIRCPLSGFEDLFGTVGGSLDPGQLLDAQGQEAFRLAREQARSGRPGAFEAGLAGASGPRWTRWTVVWRDDRFQGTVQDIGELRELAGQLHQSQKLEHLGRFLSGITHDFNNILSGVLGYNEMLLMDPALTPLQRRSLEVMHRSASRGRSLANHLLRYVRKEPPERRSSSLNDLVREVQALMQAPGPDRVAVHLDLDPKLPDLAMDTTQMVQVLMNLLANARDALSGEGRISCATRVLERSLDEARDTGGPAGPCALVEVRDTGVGIAREHQDRIFEPFFTTKGAGKGSGLGLSLVQGIVQAHGGAIRCRSALGQGTVFQVLLPLPEKGAGPWSGQSRVLVNSG